MAQIQTRLERANRLLLESFAIFSFLDEATDCLSNTAVRFSDEIHKESNFGLHLCFEAGLVRLVEAKDIVDMEELKGGKA